MFIKKVVCCGLRVMCMQFKPCAPNPQGQGVQNWLFHMHENFIKQKLEWTFPVGQCIIYVPPTPIPGIRGSWGPGVP